jgi:hypothetical protein
MSGGGGVSVFCKGDAVYDWNCGARNGGKEARLNMCGEWLGDWGTWQE